MKPIIKTKNSLFFVRVLVIGATLFVLAGQEQQKEFVQVVNVEMILRVFKDGAPVGGLKKSDFSLYEDGAPCEINGFFENRRHLVSPGESSKQSYAPRVYLLLFWVGNPVADVEGVLNKFFSSIYREGDRVVLSTSLNTFELQSPEAMASTRAAFLEQWRQEAKDKLQSKLQYHAEMNRSLEDLVRRLQKIQLEIMAKKKERSTSLMEKGTEPARETEAEIGPSENAIDREVDAFIAHYTQAIQEYRIRELSPNVSAFEAMARSMIPIKNEKFALVFFQHDSLPLFDNPSVKSFCLAKRILDSTADRLASALSVTESKVKNSFDIRILSEQLKSLFIQADIQFHLLSLSPDKSDRNADARSFFSLTRSEELFSNWDQVMQEISKNTGGLRLDGDRMVDVLDRIIDFEDISYHIFYVPRNQGAGKRKIEVRVNQPGMKVIYGRSLELSGLPQLKITGMAIDSQSIRLELGDFYRINKDGLPTGFVTVDVSGRQTDDETPQLLLAKDSETDGTVELQVRFPQPGYWDLEVRVTDQITGQQGVKKAMIDIAGAIPVPVEGSAAHATLQAVLAKAAAYAEKLKGAAFHFICREVVSEDIFPSGGGTNPVPAAMRTDWEYDYQIIVRNGKITETRVLLKKNREKLHLEKAQLETLFQSYFSYYMPVTILAKEKQRLYHYRLLGKEMLNGKSVLHIAADRRSPDSIPWGELWVGEDDGTVLKIQVDQTSIVGFEKLAQKAVEKGAMPAITTVHEYSLEKNGIRFPSKTTFSEGYKLKRVGTVQQFASVRTDASAGKSSVFERSRTCFEYRDHLFFSVSTQVVEKPE